MAHIVAADGVLACIVMNYTVMAHPGIMNGLAMVNISMTTDVKPQRHVFPSRLLCFPGTVLCLADQGLGQGCNLPTITQVGRYDPVEGSGSTLGSLLLDAARIVWPGNAKTVPQDGTYFLACQHKMFLVISSFNAVQCPAGERFLEDTFTCIDCTLSSVSMSDASVSMYLRLFWQGAAGLASNSTERNVDCDPCTAGFFSAEEQASVCTPCPPGLFSDDNGATGCTACNTGGDSRYQPSQGSSSCIDCPENTQLIHNTSLDTRSDCICQPYFWRPDGMRGASLTSVNHPSTP